MARPEQLPQVKIPKTVNVYRLTNEQYTRIINAMANIDVGVSVESYLTGSNFYQGITNILQIPQEFYDGSVGSNVKQIDSGMWTIDSNRSDGSGEVLGEKLNFRHGTTSIYQIYVPAQHGNYLDFTNTEVTLHIPFCDDIRLDPHLVLGNTIYFDYLVDYCTGEGCAWVWNDDQLLTTVPCRIGVNVPISSFGGNLFGSLASKALSSGLFNFIPALDIASKGWLKSVNGSVVGSIGSADFMGPMKGWITVASVPEPLDDSDRANLMGLPDNGIGNLKNVTGYIRVDEIHTDGINATEAEKAEIERLLKIGVTVSSWT